MIYAILDRLKNDIELRTLLGASIDNPKIFPLKTDEDGESIVYNDSPTSGGTIKENRLELRIITDDYDKAMLIEKSLCRLLDLEENQPGFRYEDVVIMSSTLNGGGTLENEATKDIERILYFDIKWRGK